ncbi:carbohydrate ABC transporter permease [Spirochaetia bacterium 38H-sp]|uniref:Carbohydrate ABC transporter permease n=1 Tax=Rarispira pelagica TaxID=3141764 RepID=A0ABU9UAG2_9SPIR
MIEQLTVVEGQARWQDKVANVVGKTVSYIVFITWALLTLLPIVWMGYSSFKSNEELNRSVFALPHDMFDNAHDEYKVLKHGPGIRYPKDLKVPKEQTIVIESTTIAPGRRYMVFFLDKKDLPPALANLKPGDKLTVDQLPKKYQTHIHWKTVWFNYESAITYGKLGLKFINSIIYTAGSTLLIVLLSLMVGFALGKLPFPKLSAVIGGFFGLGYLLSIPSIIIPLFLMMSSVGLVDTHIGIIIVYVAFGLPLGVMLASQFIKGLPDSLVESAYIDGASLMRMFFSIIVPMARPVAITIGIINGLGIWNEFLLVLVLASSEATKSLPVGVFSFSSLTSTQLGWQMAALVIAALPVIIVYAIFNRRIAEGVVAGAVKG